MATLLKFEGRFGKHLHRLFANIEQQPEGQVFDLKESVARYAYDVISDLAFEKDLNTQSNPEANELPPIPDHILIGTMYGMVASLLPYSIRIGNKLPIPSLQKLLQSRKLLSQKASEYVNDAIEDHKAGEKETLLDNLLEAKDPSTGAPLTPAEVSSEAFAFLYVAENPDNENSTNGRIQGCRSTYHICHVGSSILSPPP
jgi:benzoate 4-monooxygenase